ncbi:hypothetical protein RHGRI_023921 [Rhododendron griersonianum]|uniref:Uncharacterized protein n=1 Tax=Rhododendron griersonianum TaxID=479676 RepID=A0AAV6J7M3_9ERIC|nr:hypothetical protein RHGRI_028065 [Rhododendron griersonianum]KAG5536305.1 hypothetical protein RHGRI_023921 [Rhododendron griersonianum]
MRRAVTMSSVKMATTRLLCSGHKGKSLLWFRIHSGVGSRASSLTYQNSRKHIKRP